MDDYYLCSRVFVFLLKREYQKTEYSVRIYATLVTSIPYKIKATHAAECMSGFDLNMLDSIISYLSYFFSTDFRDYPKVEIPQINL